MNNASTKITVEVGSAGIDIKASPLAEAFLHVVQERLQEQVTPEFVAHCLYLAAKGMPATRRRQKKQPPAPTPTASGKPEGSSNEK